MTQDDHNAHPTFANTHDTYGTFADIEGKPDRSRPVALMSLEQAKQIRSRAMINPANEGKTVEIVRFVMAKNAASGLNYAVEIIA